MKSHEFSGLIYTLCFLCLALTAAICVPNILQKMENSRIVVPDFQQEQSYQCAGNICQGQNFRQENLKSKEPAVGAHQIGYPKCASSQTGCDRASDNMNVDHTLPADLSANMNTIHSSADVPSASAIPENQHLVGIVANIIGSILLWVVLACEFLKLFVPIPKWELVNGHNTPEADRAIFGSMFFFIGMIIIDQFLSVSFLSIMFGVVVGFLFVICIKGGMTKVLTTQPVTLLEIVEQIVHDERLVPSDREELAERIAEYKKVDAEIPQIDQSIVVNRLKLQDAEMLLQKGRASLEKVESITRKSASDELLIRNYHQQIEGLESGNELLAERIQCQECLHQQKVVRRAELVEFFQDKAMQAESFDEYDAFVAEQIKFLKELEPMAQQPVETVAPLADELKIS